MLVDKNNQVSNTITSQNEYFCYIYISQTAQAWSCIAYFGIGLFLLYKSIRQFHLTKKMNKSNSIINYTYYSIFVSLGFYLVKVTFAQIIFWIQFNNSPDESTFQKYSLASKFLFTIDFCEIFTIQTATLLVPTNWMRNMISIIKIQSQKLDNSPQKKKELKKQLKFQLICNKIMMAYFVIRIFLYFGPFIPFFILHNQDNLKLITLIMMIEIEIEFLSVIIILLLTIVSIHKNKFLREILENNDIRLMQKRYIALALCVMLRFLTDIYFTVVSLQYLTHQSKCYIEQSASTRIDNNIINIILEGLITQFFSIYAILKAYEISRDKASEILIETRRSVQSGSSLLS